MEISIKTTLDAGRVFGRGISFPPRLSTDGRLLWSEGEQNIREAIRVILLTEERERINLPEFGGGLGQFLFEPNTVMTRHLIQDRIASALAAWEPRIRIESIDVQPDPGDAQAAVVTITYQLVATQARERVSLGVTLSG
jgi:phage baseplate assembly protein W